MLIFLSNCQTSIDHQISSSLNCLKCRDLNANIECISKEFSRIPPLIFLEVGHLTTCLINERSIEEMIRIPHRCNQLEYTLLAFTIHSGIHFNMKIKYEETWYTYDGMERPKVKKWERWGSSITCGRVNCIFYLLTGVIDK